MKIGRLLVRLVVGGLFIGHGTQKLFGWFGGPGPDGTEQMMYKIDMHPGAAPGVRGRSAPVGARRRPRQAGRDGSARPVLTLRSR